MYEELVKELRDSEEWATKDGGIPVGLIYRLSQAADVIEELSHDYEELAEDFNGAVELLHKRKKPRWIPVTERLPESGEHALVMRFDYVTSTPFCDLLWFDNGEWWNRHFKGNYSVTHWMPLPEPPKEESNGV